MAKQEKKEKQKKSLVGRIVKTFLLVLFLLLLLTALIGGGWFYNKYGRELLEYREEGYLIAAASKREDFASAETSICYYSDGSVMQILKGEKNVYYLPYKAIPKHAVNAMLAVEDRKFFEHKGYDIYAIARAARAYLEKGGVITQGGSTITQQLARAVYLSGERTVKRKVTEIFLAVGLEKKYSKYDILEFYLNNIYFANGYYGLQAAAVGYFGKAASELDLCELAFLCGIPNSPSTYNPRKNYDSTMERCLRILRQMYENNFISAEEYQEASAERPVLSVNISEKNNYEETYTYYCAVRALMEEEGFNFNGEGYPGSEDYAYDELYTEEYSRIKHNLYTKGYRIYTSINRGKQESLQEAVDSGLADFTEVNEEGIYKIQGSGVTIDNETGFVVAIIGGRAQDYPGYTLNRAYQSPRQPGSSIKPLIVYTPLFERGYYPDTPVTDERFEGGPRNSSNVYSGEIDIRYAVAQSKNTVAWKLFEELGIETGLDYLLRMNFRHITKEDYYPAASLGGLSYGATAEEMTAAYATLANKGVYRTPTCIMRITDTLGNVIVDNTSKAAAGVKTQHRKRIYGENASLMMTDTLMTVMESGTGRKLKPEGITSAGKTGTTNDHKDGWFVGFTAYYTTGIWVGADMPVEIEDLMGNTYPGRIWQAYMLKIHEGLEDREFDKYTDDRPKPLTEDAGEEDGAELTDTEETGTEWTNPGEGDGAELTDTEETGTEWTNPGEGDGAGLTDTEETGTEWTNPGEEDTIWTNPGENVTGDMNETGESGETETAERNPDGEPDENPDENPQDDVIWVTPGEEDYWIQP